MEEPEVVVDSTQLPLVTDGEGNQVMCITFSPGQRFPYHFFNTFENLKFVCN